jgi:hypothetical protein
MSFAFPERAPARPGWLVTLADLALLLVGFLLLMQATRPQDRPALAQALRAQFAAAPAALPVAAAGVHGFAPGSARVPGDGAALLAWARDAARDPRVQFTVTGGVDGSARDVDPATGSAALLAADRARGVAALLSRAVPPARLTLAADARPRGRGVAVTLAFAGEP